MKHSKIFIVLMIALLPVASFAQTQVKASRILDQINRGKAVNYENAEIVGDLDFTKVDEVKKDKPFRWRSRNSTITYSCHVRSPISFVNCTFRGSVIAYLHVDRKNETYNAVFHENVDFSGCEFMRYSEFKYAKFHKKADFEGTAYHREAYFKYAKFSSPISFAGSNFKDDANFKYATFPDAVYFNKAVFKREANFKYTKFPEGVNFESAEFQGEANFKYTKFPGGVSFENAVFQGDANFKYTKFNEPINFDGADFENDAEFKYARVAGKSMVTYLLKRRD